MYVCMYVCINIIFYFYYFLYKCIFGWGGGGGGGGCLKFSFAFITPREEWAVPGGTAIQGQLMAEVEQAPDTLPKVK